MSETTPRPWRVGYDGPSRPIISTADRGVMLTIGKLEGGRGRGYAAEDADAALIVAAVNASDAAEALADAVEGLKIEQHRAGSETVTDIHGYQELCDALAAYHAARED